MKSDKLFLGNDTYLNINDLSTHTFVCGATGSGKTVTSKVIIEEALLRDIPVLAFDLKGDVSSLLYPLQFYTQEKFDDFNLGSLEKYMSNLEQYGYNKETIEKLKTQINTKIYSPFGSIGIPLGFSPIPKKPIDDDLIPEAKNFASSNLLSNLGKFSKDSLIENVFIQSLIDYFWSKNIELIGLKGLKLLISSISNPPINTIGVRDLDSFISEQKRDKLANYLNANFVANEDLFYGTDINDMDSILGNSPSLNVIDLSGIQDFSIQSQIIALASYSVFNWMKLKGESDMPRLLIFIDEIGGGGGGTALLPSDPFSVPSKIPLRLLLRQGRAFGVSLILATQSPGDVDYKSLANCLTWFIGKLNRKTDRMKVLEAISGASNNDTKNFEAMISSLDDGKMIFFQKGNYTTFKPRWLLTPHKTLSKEEKLKIINSISKDWNFEFGANTDVNPDNAPVFFENLKILSKKNENYGLNSFLNKSQSIMSEIQGLYNNLKTEVNQNFQNAINVLHSLQDTINFLKNIDVIPYINFLDSLSKNELLAVFDGYYDKKTLFSSKRFTAPLLQESLIPLLQVYKEKLYIINDRLSYFGERENFDINSEFNDFLDSLKNSIFGVKKSCEIIKKTIQERILYFFSLIIDKYSQKIAEIEENLKIKHNEFLSDLSKNLKTAIHLNDSISSNLKRYFEIYDFFKTYKAIF